jgi:hypothetical protein
MWRFLLGPALLGSACIGGSIYGRTAEQIVHKDPALVQAAVAQAVSGARRSGTMQLEGGKPVPYEIELDDSESGNIGVRLLLAGREGARTKVYFASQNGGNDTLMIANVHTDHAVLRDALAGTSKEKLGYAPDWLLNIALKKVLAQLAQQIEKGDTLGDPMQGFAPPDPEARLTAQERQAVAEWQQYDATRPAVDPDEAARSYLGSR